MYLPFYTTGIMSKPSSRLKRFILSPARALICWLRDAYIRGITGCAYCAQASGIGLGHSSPLPSELMHNSCQASTGRMRTYDEKLQATELRRASSLSHGQELRSKSMMAIHRKDRACEFEEDARVGVDQYFLIPRSRSFVIVSKRRPAPRIRA